MLRRRAFVRGVAGFRVRAGHFLERHRLVVVIALGESIVAIGVGAGELDLTAVSSDERATLARDSHSCLHLPMITGIVFVALGIEQTLAHVGEPLGVIPAIALGGGGALYLLGHSAFRLRDTGTVSRPRFVVAAVACLLIPVAVLLPSFVALAGLTVLLSGLAAFETLRSESRQQVRTG